MGIWAGIKHAVNSTLGTSNFKPLDQLMDDKISSALAGYSCVRHIQQGHLTRIKTTNKVSLSGFQNFNKMVAFVSGGGGRIMMTATKRLLSRTYPAFRSHH